MKKNHVFADHLEMTNFFQILLKTYALVSLDSILCIFDHYTLFEHKFLRENVFLWPSSALSAVKIWSVSFFTAVYFNYLERKRTKYSKIYISIDLGHSFARKWPKFFFEKFI